LTPISAAVGWLLVVSGEERSLKSGANAIQVKEGAVEVLRRELAL
jgi:hypothetical protein